MDKYEYQVIVHPEPDAHPEDVCDIFQALANEAAVYREQPDWADQSYSAGMHWYVRVFGPESRAAYVKEMGFEDFPYDRPERIVAAANSDDGFGTEYIRQPDGQIMMAEGNHWLD